MTERCWEIVHAPNTSGQYRYGSTFAAKKKAKFSNFQIGKFEEELLTVLGQSLKERWWDVVIGERLWSPQNTFPLSFIASSIRLCHRHLLYASSKAGDACGGTQVTLYARECWYFISRAKMSNINVCLSIGRVFPSNNISQRTRATTRRHYRDPFYGNSEVHCVDDSGCLAHRIGAAR